MVNIMNKDINYITFSKKKGKNVFKKSYYSPLIHTEVVKNDIKLKENLIITGPNASGKTTALKTTLINIILSQQFGCGCFKSGKLYPYKYIHCYLNIPDTSGRDSLFQSEVRRCKEIIQLIIENSEETHFCVFDELYSGTNPDEAVTSSTAFMEYIVKFKNVFCMLTTHFIQVCHNLDKNDKILNYHMDVSEKGNTLKYNYSLKSGISEVKGGLKVLYDMDYPEEIIENLKNIKINNSLVK
jgi:DNA mismatch repair ATPase MutS